jgi:curved DNA-binding protein CbpA
MADTERERDHLFAWLEGLDDLSYYDLLGVEQDATADAVQEAFHAFCATFHPDGHVARPDDERGALSTIFKRGTEAYSVLGDPALRAQYDEQLATPGSPQPPRASLSPHSRPPRSRAPGVRAPLEDTVRSPSARPFARRAEELMGQGDLRQAKLQLVMANHMDPGNESLEAALRDIEAKLGSPK